MRLNGSRVIYEDVDVSIVDAWVALRIEILKKAGIHPSWYLVSSRKPDYFYEDEESGHGSSSDIEVRKASKEQLAVYNAVLLIENTLLKTKTGD